ncbi:hypothetical protein IP88_14955 [alpha proteobacterium AAP81b]|nr:hypothetical protein IP88_14955 [alpha proteobacterium AAP81b]
MRLSHLLIAALLALVAAPLAAAPTRFAVSVTGQGPDIILIPGLASPAATWDTTVAHLKPRYRVHIVEVAGFAGRPAGPNANGELIVPTVAELAAYIAEAGLARPIVIGHSLGGFMGLVLAARYPASLGAVIVVDTTAGGALEETPGQSVEAARAALAKGRDALAATSQADYATSIPATLAGLIKNDAERARLTPLIARSDPRAVARAYYDQDSLDLRPELARGTRSTAVPIAVVYSYDPKAEAYGGDPARADAFFARGYRGVPVARMIRIDDSFHFVMADQPQRFQAALDDLLGSLPRTTPWRRITRRVANR